MESPEQSGVSGGNGILRASGSYTPHIPGKLPEWTAIHRGSQPLRQVHLRAHARCITAPSHLIELWTFVSPIEKLYYYYCCPISDLIHQISYSLALAWDTAMKQSLPDSPMAEVYSNFNVQIAFAEVPQWTFLFVFHFYGKN